MTSSPWALITGAGSGLGAEYAAQLAQSGHSLVLVGRDNARLEMAATRLRAGGAVCEILVADLHSSGDVKRVGKRLASHTHPIRVLVNNAGYGIHGTLASSDSQQERDHLAVHVTAPMELMKAALPGMIDRGEGRIVMVSSVAGYLARGTYSAHKAWGLSIARSLHATYRRQGIHVSAVAPGFTRTEFHQRMEMKTDIFPEIMWLKASDVVRASLRGVELGKAVVIPSLRYKVLVALATVLPARVHQAGT
ncbi:MAG: SDR family NAD(P)-dependent oxidoreductase [Pontimonas sp.]